MTLAIAGSDSMVGKRIERRLSATCEVVRLGRRPGADVRMDLSAAVPTPPASRTADVMIHCAASFGGNQIDQLIENELVNSVGSIRVAKLAAEMKCNHLIYVSSVSALGENSAGSSYGLSKRHGQENLELACARLGIDLTSLSVTQLYDDLGHARKHQPTFYRIIDCAREGRTFSLFGTADPLRNFLFVEDFVSMIARVIDRRITGSHAVAHPKSHRLSEVVATAFRVFGRIPQIERRPDAPSLPAYWIPSDLSMYDQIDFRPETDLEMGIALIRDHMQ